MTQNRFTKETQDLLREIKSFNADFDPADFLTDGILDPLKLLANGNFIQSIEWNETGGLRKIEFVGGKKLAPVSVYLIKAENGLTKIGVTTNVQKRFETLFTMSPVDLVLIASGCMPNGYQFESQLHERFKDKRIKGEWFALTDEDIEEIRAQFCKLD